MRGVDVMKCMNAHGIATCKLHNAFVIRQFVCRSPVIYQFLIVYSRVVSFAFSFDSIGLGMSQNHCGNGNGVASAGRGCSTATMDGGALPSAAAAAAAGRRGSFLYRSSDSSSDLSPMSLSRKLSTVDAA